MEAVISVTGEEVPTQGNMRELTAEVLDDVGEEYPDAHVVSFKVDWRKDEEVYSYHVRLKDS